MKKIILFTLNPVWVGIILKGIILASFFFLIIAVPYVYGKAQGIEISRTQYQAILKDCSAQGWDAKEHGE